MFVCGKFQKPFLLVTKCNVTIIAFEGYNHLILLLFSELNFSACVNVKTFFLLERLQDKIKDICLWKILKAFLISN